MLPILTQAKLTGAASCAASYEAPVHADIPHQGVIFLDGTDPISSPMKAKGVAELGMSGGGIEVMRPWVETVYGILPEQVVGSSGVTRFKRGRMAHWCG